jgi:APA family basic amino acid/polyamine antiporter
MRAVLIGCGSGIVYLSFRSFEQLTDSFVAGMFPFYMLAVVAVLLLRRRQPELPRPFRTPLYPLVAGVFLLGASALLFGAARDVHGIAFAAFGVMLLGLPLGFALSRGRARAAQAAEAAG